MMIFDLETLFDLKSRCVKQNVFFFLFTEVVGQMEESAFYEQFVSLPRPP